MLSRLLAFPRLVRNRFIEQSQPDKSVSDLSDARPLILFASCLIFYIAYLLALQPGWMLDGGMWAEMATNYFANANAPELSQKLFSTDAGYIPFPQRLICLLGYVLNLPASSIPYFYTWTAVALTAMMVGAFCLRPFRILVKSDLLRFFTAVAVLMVADFESRTFINFTYFSAFFAAILTALALADDTSEVPWWAWVLPVLMVSKPAVLSVLPAMMIASSVSNPRFRRITIVVLLVCIAQLIRMTASHHAGAFTTANTIGVFDKLHASIKYFVGFIGAYSFGKAGAAKIHLPILLGTGILFLCSLVLFKKRKRSGSLILVGLSLLFFNVTLNCFALSDSWNLDMARLAGVPLYRHIIVGFFGVVLTMTGLIDGVSERASLASKFITNNSGAKLFFAWFVLSGWFIFAGKVTRLPASPVTHNSQWESLATVIDSGAPVCVPVDPFGWVYQRNCKHLNPSINWMSKYHFEPLPLEGSSSVFTVAPSAYASGQALLSIAALVSPQTMQAIPVSATAVIEMNDGTSRFFSGGRTLSSSAGLLLMMGKEAVPIKDIRSIKLVFSAPVGLAILENDASNSPAILWMGN